MRSPAFYWKAACEFGPKGFTTADLAGCTCGVAYATVRNWIRVMRHEGELVVVGSVPSLAGKPKHVYAVKRPRAKGPGVRRPESDGSYGLITEQIWQTMRMLKGSWTTEELALASSTEEVVVLRNTTQRYVRSLVRAGIVQLVKPSVRTNRGSIAARYNLTRTGNTGPLPPKLLQAEFVYDQNTQKIVGESEVRNGLV